MGRKLRRFLLVAILWVGGCSRDATGPGPDRQPNFEGRASTYTVSSFESRARGEVYFSVYLPPGWSPDGTETYPLIFFLHGQGGTERSFTNSVPVSELNQWISDGSVPPFVLVAPRGSDVPDNVQWYYQQNVTLLTSEAPDELRAFCWETFRAGGSREKISVHGHSRGASGALYFALNHWDEFGSAVANAFVSDYVLDDRRESATRNRDAILLSGIPIRMTIGTEDAYVKDLRRIGSQALHQHLDTLGISHEYEVLPGVSHSLSEIWHFERSGGGLNGLYELQFHARTWGGS